MTNPEQNQNAGFRARMARSGGDGLDPLPPAFEASLRSLDRRMADAARQVEDPAGLEDRVHAASVRLLPRRMPRPVPVTTGGRRGFSHRRLLAFRSLSGQLALAASLGLAFVLGSILLRGPAGGSGSDPVAAVASALGDLALDAGWLADEPFEDMDRAVAHLLDTRSLTMADLTGEIDSIVASSEM